MKIPLVVGIWILAGAGLLLLWRYWYWRERLQLRLDDPKAPPIEIDPGAEDTNWLRRWLALAGFRRRAAVWTFITSTVLCTALGASVAFGFLLLGLGDQIASGLSVVPGGVGEVLLPAVYGGPWFLWMALAIGPTLYVRRARRERVEKIEQDLPIALDLLATLGESGVGFDAALEKVCDTRLAHRPLAVELRRYQADLLSGQARVASLRRLSKRIELTSTSVLVSALVQAEQLGMGLAEVLKRQAADLRDRRRERANTFAASLPVKLMFPLVACFLPGIFVWTLGPIFRQFFQIADTIIRTRSL
jgi:tight adherence protein C